MLIISKVVRRLIKFFLFFLIKQENKRIVFVQESFSGSNAYALWKFMKNELSEEYDLILFKDDNLNTSLIKYYNKFKLLYSAKLILTTHASYKPTKNHIHYQLWHGGTTKKAKMDLKKSNGIVSKSWKEVNYILSYSETSSTFLNAIMLADFNKYIVTGAPRNDFLLNSNSNENLKNIFPNIDFTNKKILFYLPTYRDFYGVKLGDKKYDNPFGFSDFNLQNFDTFLELNKLIIIIKIHPHEEAILENYFNNYSNNNFLIIKDYILEQKSIDLYELLGSADALITDYSSVYYDFLLLNRPIIFIPIDIESYNNNMGFLIENYNEWFIGEKVFDYTNFIKVLENTILNDENILLKSQRKIMQIQHHRYIDGDSSKRVASFIKSII